MMDEASKGHDSATVVKQPDNYDPVKANEQRIAEEQRRQALADHAERMIERDKLDPRQQWYLKNNHTGRIIRKEADYHRALENHHEVVQISYNQALDLYKKEEAEKKDALKKVQHRKRSKAARKRNR